MTEQFRKAFENQCVHLFIEGYRKLRANSYDIAWEEEKFSMEIARSMETCLETLIWKIDIVSEPRLYSEAMTTGGVAPREAPRIDFRLSNWSTVKKFIYHLEAKNLAENDWQKSTGPHVIASALNGRYIDTGIDNYVNGRYQTGCLIGYVLNGKAPAVVNKINDLLTKRGRKFESILMASPVNGHNLCYQSLNQKNSGESFILQHIFVEFQ